MSDRDPDIGCAVLHEDSEGRTVPRPGDHPMPPPELSEVDQLRADNESLRYQIERARWALGTGEPVNEQLRQAEICAAVAEREAEAYRNQVKALVRAIQRERGLPEEGLDGEVFVVAAEPSQPIGEAIGKAVDRLLAPKTPMAEVPPTRHGPSWPGRPANRTPDHGTVQGRCPACGNTLLFVGSGGSVTCSCIDCPDPDAASSLLADPQCPAETEVPEGARRVRCVMPLWHDDFHADSTGLRWGEEGLLSGPGQALPRSRRDDWMRTVRVLGVLSVACGILAVVATVAAIGGDSDAVEAALAAAGAKAILAWAAFSIWRGERD